MLNCLQPKNINLAKFRHLLLFQDNCPLNQSVLLSLIQQLGSKLHDRTEIKLKYLEEAVTHLDTSDASIEVREILDQVNRAVQ